MRQFEVQKNNLLFNSKHGTEQKERKFIIESLCIKVLLAK